MTKDQKQHYNMGLEDAARLTIDRKCEGDIRHKQMMENLARAIRARKLVPTSGGKTRRAAQ